MSSLRRLSFVACLLLQTIAGVALAQRDLKNIPDPDPEIERKTFIVADGFEVNLWAADPQMAKPIQMNFDPQGRLWIAASETYPQIAPGQKANDKILILEDTDGDGRFDKRTVFMDGLVLPRAMSLVGDGVLIAEPPHLWFCRDTNGDGRADQKVEIAKDYGNIDNPEHNANGLMWAMDNWIYSANFNARFRYQGDGRFTREPTIMRGQWGISQDDGGRLFYNSNSDPLRVDLIASEYLRRNPNFAASGTNVQVAPANLPVSPGRVTPGINRGYNTLDASGREYAVTSACGPVIYRGTLFPAEFRGDAFIAEPSGNLVKRIRLALNATGGIE